MYEKWKRPFIPWIPGRRWRKAILSIVTIGIKKNTHLRPCSSLRVRVRAEEICLRTGFSGAALDPVLISMQMPTIKSRRQIGAQPATVASGWPTESAARSHTRAGCRRRWSRSGNSRPLPARRSSLICRGKAPIGRSGHCNPPPPRVRDEVNARMSGRKDIPDE
jgi:hypothetical protein